MPKQPTATTSYVILHRTYEEDVPRWAFRTLDAAKTFRKRLPRGREGGDTFMIVRVQLDPPLKEAGNFKHRPDNAAA